MTRTIRSSEEIAGLAVELLGNDNEAECREIAREIEELMGRES